MSTRHHQIIEMRNHLPVEMIASRLGISKRTVQRVLKNAAAPGKRIHYCRIQEDAKISLLHHTGYAVSKIGWMLGLSRQSVHNRLQQLKEKEAA